MSKELFHAILNHKFYANNKDLITDSLFSDEGELRKLFNVVEWAYETVENNLTIEEVKSLYNQRFPADTEVKKQLAYMLLDSLKGLEPMQYKVAELVLKQARINNLQEHAASILLQRNEANLEAVKELMFEIERLKGAESNSDTIDMDIVSLLARTSRNSRWKFNIPELSDMAGGLGDGVFTLIAGRVNSGKSLAGISFCFAPGGFADQGAKILYMCNEEDGAFPGLRAVAAYTGMTFEEIGKNTELAAKTFAKIRPNSIVLDNARISMSGLTKAVERYKPDIVVADMLDHIHISGEFAREDMRLGQLYRQAREIAKVYRCAFIGVSQTSAESDGKLHYGFDALANSKTDKPAACDLILLLGQNPPDGAGNYSELRAINVAKNKITGRHGAVQCVIQPLTSRLVA